jgi:amino acid transporter
VARSWGEKLGLWLNSVGISLPWFLNPDCGFNIFGALLQLACTALLAVGVEMGQLTINAFTVLKVIIVIFIIIAGLAYFEPKNLSPFAPFGVTGIMKCDASCISRFEFTDYFNPILFIPKVRCQRSLDIWDTMKSVVWLSR